MRRQGGQIGGLEEGEDSVCGGHGACQVDGDVWEEDKRGAEKVGDGEGGEDDARVESAAGEDVGGERCEGQDDYD